MKIKFKKVTPLLEWGIRLAILIIGIGTIIQKQYGDTGIIAITWLLTFYYVILEKCFKIQLDEIMRIILILFIFSAQCLGSVLDFYGKFLWWDTMLHTLSGGIFFYIGVTVIEQINQRTTKANIAPSIKILFGICFSLSIGVVWEIIEFLIDRYLGGNMQITKGLMGQEAIMDTMIDLIVATIGTMIASFIVTRKKRKIEE